MMPDVGEGIAEAELSEWFVHLGDEVALDDPIVEVVTDKATFELPSPVNGRVIWLAGERGDHISVGSELIRFEIAGAGSDAEEVRGDITKSTVPASDGSRQESDRPAESLQDLPIEPARESEPGDRFAGTPLLEGDDSRQAQRPRAAPSVRRHAADLGIDLRTVAGSGPGGRIVHTDLERFAQAGAMHQSVQRSLVTEIPITGIRRVIAERMSTAKEHIPHITYVEEIDVTEIGLLRQTLNDRYGESRSRLTLLPFLMRAVSCVAAEQPGINARFDDDAAVLKQYRDVHIGIATQTHRGLVVPVVFHAQMKNLWDSAEEVDRLATAVRQGTATPGDLTGSTITISSLGALGGLVTTPIINYPEVAILGVNKIQIRPVWDGATFVPRSMMNLSSSFDHRIVDGLDAAKFVQRIKELLEDPVALFVESANG